ncbi:MAG TPA: hypothetical protein VKR32_09290, partial [Puia sp.]|nr:hypothetical protein [Puia sp.]
MEQVTERNIYDFIARGGEMGERIRNFDWESTPLGRRESWSESLRSMVNIMLANRLPMLIWWGNEYIQLYNDAYIPVPGLKHPKKSLGVPGYECWSEIWGVLKPLVDMPFNGGPPTWMDDILLIVHRNGFDEETHFFIAYSPIPDETSDSGIGGVLATVNEITEQVLSNRTIETLRHLSAKSAGAQTENEVYEKVCLALRRNDKDFTFACLYKVSQDGKFGQLVSSTENERVSYGLPLNFKIDPNDPDPAISNISKAIVENSTLLSDAPEGDLPGGAWETAPHQIIFVPVKHSNKKFAHAILYA